MFRYVLSQRVVNNLKGWSTIATKKIISVTQHRLNFYEISILKKHWIKAHHRTTWCLLYKRCKKVFLMGFSCFAFYMQNCGSFLSVQEIPLLDTTLTNLILYGNPQFNIKQNTFILSALIKYILESNWFDGSLF